MDLDVMDEALAVENEAAFEMAREVSRTEGIPVGISGGAALVAAYEVAARPEMAAQTVVVVIPAFAERYLSTPLVDGVAERFERPGPGSPVRTSRVADRSLPWPRRRKRPIQAPVGKLPRCVVGSVPRFISFQYVAT